MFLGRIREAAKRPAKAGNEETAGLRLRASSHTAPAALRQLTSHYGDELMDIRTGLGVITNHQSPHLCKRPEMVEYSSTERGAMSLSDPSVQRPGMPLILRLHLMRPVRHCATLILSCTR